MSNSEADIVVELTQEQLRIIRQCLNEVANGIDFSDDELMIRIGSQRNEIKAVLDRLRPTKPNAGTIKILVSYP